MVNRSLNLQLPRTLRPPAWIEAKQTNIILLLCDAQKFGQINDSIVIIGSTIPLEHGSLCTEWIALIARRYRLHSGLVQLRCTSSLKQSACAPRGLVVKNAVTR